MTTIILGLLIALLIWAAGYLIVYGPIETYHNVKAEIRHRRKGHY